MNSKWIGPIALVMAFAVATRAYAGERNLVKAGRGPSSVEIDRTGQTGLGLLLGTAGALSGKHWLTGRGAFDLGFEFFDRPWHVAYGDFLWHVPGLFGRGSRFGRESALYFGAGTGVGFWTREDRCGRWRCTWSPSASGTGTGFFVRAVVGTEWYPTHTRFGVFGELAPSRMYYPSSGSTFDVTVGARYYF